MMQRQTSPQPLNREPPCVRGNLADASVESSPPVVPPVLAPALAPALPPVVVWAIVQKEVPGNVDSQEFDFQGLDSAAIADKLVGDPQAETSETAQRAASHLPRRRWFRWPDWFLARCLDSASLTLLLAVVAAIPILQLASLGYLLNSAAILSRGGSWTGCFPGLRLAGRLGTFALLATLCWLPVWFVNDLSYSAQLLQPGSDSALAWRLGAFLISLAWVIHLAWAAMRGGRWWHFLWPAPLRFLLTIWRRDTWSRASDALYRTVTALQLPRLWWLGARGAAGALLWTVIPVSLMIIGLRSQDLNAAALVGLIGAFVMTLVMLYLPFLQIQFAESNRFSAIFDVASVRRRFRFAPLAHAASLIVLCLLCIPLYLLRIEATPAELVWAPSLVFVLFMLPAKLFLGAAVGYADRRQQQSAAVRHWLLRWPARGLALASALIYVGSLYVAQLVAGQGAYVMYFQHAFLVPAPLISS